MLAYYIDVGNTRLKLWRCDGEQVLAEHASSHYGQPENVLAELPAAFAESPSHVVIASVMHPVRQQEFASACQARWGITPCVVRVIAEACGVRNGYRTPGQLGIDRWLGLLGATGHRQGRSLCIADCGTALTIDVLLSDGRHAGGYIMPGLAMMAGGLLQGTSGVRFDRLAYDSIAPGQDTAAATSAGVLLAAAAAIDAVALRHGAKVVLTGGDAVRLRAHLTAETVVDRYLVLRGMQHYLAATGIS